MLIIVGVAAVLAAGVAVADQIMAHCERIERFISGLPLGKEEDQ